MNASEVDRLRKLYKNKPTRELQDIWFRQDHAEWHDEVFEAIRLLFVERGVPLNIAPQDIRDDWRLEQEQQSLSKATRQTNSFVLWGCVCILLAIASCLLLVTEIVTTHRAYARGVEATATVLAYKDTESDAVGHKIRSRHYTISYNGIIREDFTASGFWKQTGDTFSVLYQPKQPTEVKPGRKGAHFSEILNWGNVGVSLIGIVLFGSAAVIMLYTALKPRSQ